MVGPPWANSLGNDSPSSARFPFLLDISCDRSAPREWTVRPAIGRERMAGVEYVFEKDSWRRSSPGL